MLLPFRLCMNVAIAAAGAPGTAPAQVRTVAGTCG